MRNDETRTKKTHPMRTERLKRRSDRKFSAASRKKRMAAGRTRLTTIRTPDDGTTPPVAIAQCDAPLLPAKRAMTRKPAEATGRTLPKPYGDTAKQNKVSRSRSRAHPRRARRCARSSHRPGAGSRSSRATRPSKGFR